MARYSSLWCIMAHLNTQKFCLRLFEILALIKKPVNFNQSTTYHKAFGNSNGITSRSETSTLILLTAFDIHSVGQINTRGSNAEILMILSIWFALSKTWISSPIIWYSGQQKWVLWVPFFWPLQALGSWRDRYEEPVCWNKSELESEVDPAACDTSPLWLEP